MMIRSMVEVDIPRVFEIEQACFSDPWTMQGFKDSLNETSAHLRIIENETGGI